MLTVSAEIIELRLWSPEEDNQTLSLCKFHVYLILANRCSGDVVGGSISFSKFCICLLKNDVMAYSTLLELSLFLQVHMIKGC